MGSAQQVTNVCMPTPERNASNVRIIFEAFVLSASLAVYVRSQVTYVEI